MTNTYEKGRGYHARILLDSIGPSECRLTTWELRYPRMVHAELMTHRLFSRNSASSRAIPNERLIAQVVDDPAMPVWWGKNQSGMQAREELSDAPVTLCRTDHCGEPDGSRNGCPRWADTGGVHDFRSDREAAIDQWLEGRDAAVELSRKLAAIGLHKQIANRVLEPWMFITVIVSATEWDNWYAQRDHPDAQPEIAWVARLMHAAHRESVPRRLNAGAWHMPLVSGVDEHVLREALGRKPDTDVTTFLRKVSVGRCARVSYLTHDGRRAPEEDVALCDRLAGASPGHWSPFEHVAQALEESDPSGNFRGWRQYRKLFAAEHVGGWRP
jgi:thymidylate synthase ThyX